MCSLDNMSNAILVVDVTKLSGYYAEAAPVFAAMMQKKYAQSKSNTVDYLTAWIHTAITEIYRVAETFQTMENDGETIDLAEFSADYNNHYITPYLHDPILKRWVIDAGHALYRLYPWHTLHTSIVVYRQGLLYIYVDTVDPYRPPTEA